MENEKSLDRYVWQARVVPVLLVVFPMASLVAVWLPEESVGWRLLSGLVSLVLLSLLAQLGRDAGKRREPELFRKWNGKPSVRKLRHRDSDLPWITLERLRTRLAVEVGIPCPTQTEEYGDGDSADEIYVAYVDHLREATRGDKILLAENIGYGFRRNLWGMRTAGLVMSVGGVIGAGVGTALTWGIADMVVPATVTLVNAALASLWILRVNDGWVKEAAEAYADRLIRAYLAKPEADSNAAA
jgi:hypothetical protein